MWPGGKREKQKQKTKNKVSQIKICLVMLLFLSYVNNLVIWRLCWGIPYNIPLVTLVCALAYGLVCMQKKSQSVVGYSKLNQSCEDPISHPDVDNQRTWGRVFNIFPDLFLFRKKKKFISIKCCIRLKKFLMQTPSKEIQSILGCQWLTLFHLLGSS